MIRPYLRNLINDHKPIMELNNNNNNTKTTTTRNNNDNNTITNINTNNNNNNTNTNSYRAEWKIQLILFLLQILKILALYIQQVNQ